ncbi:MAG: hypothetical protein HXS48_10885 [Theionarchaea archaeon]|nr:hypothetical protein [Theionarchaea archaeon]
MLRKNERIAKHRLTDRVPRMYWMNLYKGNCSTAIHKSWSDSTPVFWEGVL